MSEALQTLSLVATGSLVAIPTPEDIININPTPDATPTLSFATSPQGATYSYVAGTTTYATSEKVTPVNTSITFTATVVIPVVGVSVMEYYWDFGDGRFNYGNPTTHTYTVTNNNCQVVLRVTDTRGRRWRYRKQLYIQ